MALDRKGLRTALVTALRARMVATGDPKEFLTVDIDPRNVAPSRFPLLVVEAADEDPRTDENPTPPVWDLSLDVTIYAHPAGDDTDPDATLDVLLAHLEAALERLPTEKGARSWWTNLGGQDGCVRVWPSGRSSRAQDAAGNVQVTQPVTIRAVAATRGNPT